MRTKRKKFLTKKQLERLQDAFRESDCPRFREHALILLLKNDGKTYEQIADFIGCSYRTVAYWCVNADPDNLDSMKDRRESGNSRKANDGYIALLLSVVDEKPQKLGYDFEVWTSTRLAIHMAEKTGVELSGTQVIRILRKHNVRLPMSRV